jgi:transposase
VKKIRDVLRYKHEHGLSNERIAGALGLAKGTVHNILERFRESGVGWPLPAQLSDSELEAALYERDGAGQEQDHLPDMAYIEKELRRPHVTLQLLFEEYQAACPDGLGRTAFYRYVKRHLAPDTSMRCIHKGGDVLFVDYSGDGLEYVERTTGQIVAVELFVCAWGASSHCYAEATHSQKAEDFVGSHVRAFEYFEAVPYRLVPDNLKSAVHKACRYDPSINELYRKMAEHYGTVVLPARVGTPKDKAVAESAVLQVQRFILARLRNRTFFSLVEIKEAIWELLEQLNRRGMKDHGNRSRKERFVELDLPLAKPLPGKRFVIAHIKEGVAVGRNYHIRYRDCHYSVPYQLAGKRVQVHQVGRMLEVYHDGQHVCRHLMAARRYSYTTVAGHMPPEHAWVHGWSKEYFIGEGGKHGPFTARAIEATMKRQQHVQQGFNAAMGILRLGKTHGSQRLEMASQRALHFGSPTYRSIKSILDQRLDEQSLQSSTTSTETTAVSHDNIRGAAYYTDTSVLERH